MPFRLTAWVTWSHKSSHGHIGFASVARRARTTKAQRPSGATAWRGWASDVLRNRRNRHACRAFNGLRPSYNLNWRDGRSLNARGLVALRHMAAGQSRARERNSLADGPDRATPLHCGAGEQLPARVLSALSTSSPHSTSGDTRRWPSGASCCPEARRSRSRSGLAVLSLRRPIPHARRPRSPRGRSCADC